MAGDFCSFVSLTPCPTAGKKLPHHGGGCTRPRATKILAGKYVQHPHSPVLVSLPLFSAVDPANWFIHVEAKLLRNLSMMTFP